jgi:hypothetical protein
MFCEPNFKRFEKKPIVCSVPYEFQAFAAAICGKLCPGVTGKCACLK